MNLSKLFSKRKPEWAALCSMAFKDKSGRRYYQYNDPLDMSIIRKGEIEKYLLELRYGSDLDDICQTMKTALGTSDKKGNIVPDISMLGYLIQEILDRKEMLIIPDILFSIITTIFIREDEPPAVIDEEILQEKLITFNNELQHGGLLTFFQSSGLIPLLASSDITIIDLKRLMNESLQRIQNLKRVVSFSENRLQHG